MTPLQTALQQNFPEIPWQFEKPLAPLTYFKIGGPAEAFWQATETTKLAQVVQFCHQQGYKLTILGGASNVLIADAGIQGLVVQLADSGVEKVGQTPTGLTLVKAAAGCKTALLVSQTVKLGLTGLEYFLGVPGTLGGAVYNNAHYLSHLLGQYIAEVQVLDQQGQPHHLTAAEAAFGYDTSRFQTTKEIILSVTFALASGDATTSAALIKEATEYRAQTQPLGEPSSGCIFQNVPNTPTLEQRFPQFAGKPFVPAGFLIDQAGLKGQRQGEIEVSHKHAAFMVNKGHGTSQDVLDLIRQVKDQVSNQFGVELHEEVFYLS